MGLGCNFCTDCFSGQGGNLHEFKWLLELQIARPDLGSQRSQKLRCSDAGKGSGHREKRNIEGEIYSGGFVDSWLGLSRGGKVGCCSFYLVTISNFMA